MSESDAAAVGGGGADDTVPVLPTNEVQPSEDPPRDLTAVLVNFAEVLPPPTSDDADDSWRSRNNAVNLLRQVVIHHPDLVRTGTTTNGGDGGGAGASLHAALLGPVRDNAMNLRSAVARTAIRTLLEFYSFLGDWMQSGPGGRGEIEETVSTLVKLSSSEKRFLRDAAREVLGSKPGSEGGF